MQLYQLRHVRSVRSVKTGLKNFPVSCYSVLTSFTVFYDYHNATQSDTSNSNIKTMYPTKKRPQLRKKSNKMENTVKPVKTESV